MLHTLRMLFFVHLLHLLEINLQSNYLLPFSNLISFINKEDVTDYKCEIVEIVHVSKHFND